MIEKRGNKITRTMVITDLENCYNELTKVNLTRQTLVCCLIVLKIYLIVMLSKMMLNGKLKKWLINTEIFIFFEHNLKILLVGLLKNS